MVEVDEGAVGPEDGGDLFAGEDVGGALEEEGEDLQGLGVELDAEAAAAEFAFGGVEFEDAEAVERGWRLVGHEVNQV